MVRYESMWKLKEDGLSKLIFLYSEIQIMKLKNINKNCFFIILYGKNI